MNEFLSEIIPNPISRDLPQRNIRGVILVCVFLDTIDTNGYKKGFSKDISPVKIPKRGGEKI